MHKGRLEAFSDGVIAIIITIMVLELKVPHGSDWNDLFPMASVFFSYVLSFIYIGIYWNNHHHLIHSAEKINGSIMWANMHLLFWLSLIPFTTAWMGENHFASIPTSLYGINLIFAAVAYTILTFALIHYHGKESKLAKAIGSDKKGKISLILYALAVVLSFVQVCIASAIYVLVAFIWLIPDRRLEEKK